MYQKPCRLSKYDKAWLGGSAQGGSTDIAPRDPKEEQKTVGNWYGFQQNQFKDFIANNPLLSAAQGGALSFFNQLPATLTSLQSQFGGLPQQLQNQFGQLPHQLQAQFGALPQRLMELTPTLNRTARGYLSNVIGSQGALSPEASRDVAQQTRTLANQYGAGRQLGTLGTELLNRQGAREARYNTALGQYNAATGQIAALDQAAQGLGVGLAQARQGLGTGLASTREALGTGLAGAIQNLQSGGLNQLNTTAANQQNVFSGLTNPILGYLGNLFSNNMQGRIAEAGLNQQGNIASDNKTAGLISGVLSSIGSVAGAAAMSDERVKQKIRDTGVTTKEGVPLKTWEYRTRPGVRFLSPLAQDVEKKLPNQVLTDPVSGVKFVVGFPVIQISPMERKAA